MSFIKRFFNRNSTPPVTNEELLEQNLCPNCWGKQAYEGKFQKFIVDQNKTDDGKTQRKAFILQFVEDHVSGINLQRTTNHLSCPTCKKEY